MIIENTEKHAREIIGNMLEEIKSLEQNFKSALNLQEHLIADLTNLSTDALDRVQKFKKQKDNLNIDAHVKEAREFAENYDLKNFKFSSEELEKTIEMEELAAKTSSKEKTTEADNSEESFFDQLD